MERIAGGPTPQEVAHYGNFAIHFWAPPAAKAQADRQFREFLAGVLEGATQVLLFGHARGRLAGLPPEVLPPRLAALLDSLVPADGGTTFLLLREDMLAQYPDLLVEGGFNLRRRVNDARGQSRIESINAGKLLLHADATTLQRVLDAHVPHPDVLVSAHVVVNPWAGFRHNQRAPLRQRIDAEPGRTTVMWSGANRALSFLAPRPALKDLYVRLVEGEARDM